jgi:hypothetical protein
MKGRECVVENGEATCVCQRQCAVHRRLVCGSDGHVYPNHCELHRASCMTATDITVERGVHCIKHGNSSTKRSFLRHVYSVTAQKTIKTTTYKVTKECE